MSEVRFHQSQLKSTIYDVKEAFNNYTSNDVTPSASAKHLNIAASLPILYDVCHDDVIIPSRSGRDDVIIPCNAGCNEVSKLKIENDEDSVNLSQDFSFWVHVDE